MLSEKELFDLISEGKICLEICKIFDCSESHVRKYIKKFGLEVPKKFYGVPGAKAGRPKGIPMSEKQKNMYAERFKGENNPFFGKFHTEETKKKMADNHADFSGDNNPFKKSLKNPENLEALRQRVSNFWATRTDEYMKCIKEKLSIAMTHSRRFENENFHKRHKCGFLITKKAGRIFYRSSWEKKVADFLENSDDVETFSLEPFCIKYNDDGINRYTRIDFYIVFRDNIKAIIEVKPKGLQKLEKNIKKIEAMRNYCAEHSFYFGVIDESNLNNLSNFILQIRKGNFVV